MCSCDDYDESPEFFERATVKKSRKEHRCDECAGVIPQGGTYTRVNFKFDGAMASLAICDPCEDLRRELEKIEREHDPKCNCSAPYGGLGDEVAEATRWHGERLAPFVRHWPWMKEGA